jgi:hypothetical protein
MQVLGKCRWNRSRNRALERHVAVRVLRLARLPKAARPLIAAGELVSSDHDQDAARNLALWMVAPPTSRKPCLFKKVAGSTLVLCHTFPQERPTGRSGTASAGSGKSADAEVPSFFRKFLVASAVFFTAGAGPILPIDRSFVHQAQGPPGGREAGRAFPPLRL